MLKNTLTALALALVAAAGLLPFSGTPRAVAAAESGLVEPAAPPAAARAEIDPG